MKCEKCGARMLCRESRDYGNERYREYVCECGARLGTIETKMDDQHCRTLISRAIKINKKRAAYAKQ